MLTCVPFPEPGGPSKMAFTPGGSVRFAGGAMPNYEENPAGKIR